MPVTYTTHIYFVDCIIDYMYFYQLKTIPVAFRLPLSLSIYFYLSLSQPTRARCRAAGSSAVFFLLCGHLFTYRRSCPVSPGTCEKGGAHRDFSAPPPSLPPLRHVSLLSTECVFARSWNVVGDWLGRRECRSGTASTNRIIIRQPKFA